MSFFNLCLASTSPVTTHTFYSHVCDAVRVNSRVAATPQPAILRPAIKIIDSSAFKTGIEFARSPSSKTDPDNRHLFTHPVDTNLPPLALPENTVVLLRSQYIERTKTAYESYSSWEKEKHGNGPTHFSSTWGKTIVEIYPQRKLSSASLELLILVENIALVIEKIKRENPTILQESARHILLKDPDERLVQILTQ